MKKVILLVLVLLLLLTACQSVLDSTEDPTVATPSSSSITPPSSSVAPPTSSVPPTVPTTLPADLDKTGYSFIYKGYAPFISIDPDCSECTVGHLYWVDKITEKVTHILEEQTQESIVESGYVYYVKAEEPTKIYRTPISDFSRHEMIYESAHGKISDIKIDTYTICKQLVLQFVADEKKFVILELDTGEDAVLTEQYYIQAAMFDYSITDTWEEQTVFVFWGKIDESDSVKEYKYVIATGEIFEQSECAD